MIPSGVTSRTPWLPYESMNTSPEESIASPTGRPIAAEVAALPSPLSPPDPSPAKMLIAPAGVTL